MDVKFVPSYCVADGQKYYQFTAKDECTHWTYREMYDEHSTASVKDFLEKLVRKAKAVFPTDDSLLKMLYLAMMDITKKWTGRRQDWSVIHAQLAIYYTDRMPE